MPIIWDCQSCGTTFVDGPAVVIEIDPHEPPPDRPWDICREIIKLCPECGLKWVPVREQGN
jgi:hypothetical protein